MEQISFIRNLSAKAPEFYKLLLDTEEYKRTEDAYRAYLEHRQITQEVTLLPDDCMLPTLTLLLPIYQQLHETKTQLQTLKDTIMALMKNVMNYIYITIIDCVRYRWRFSVEHIDSDCDLVVEVAYAYEHVKDPNFSVEVHLNNLPKGFPKMRVRFPRTTIPVKDSKGIALSAYARYNVHELLAYEDAVNGHSPPPPSYGDDIEEKKKLGQYEFRPPVGKYSDRNCVYRRELNRVLPVVYFMCPYESYEKCQFAGYLLDDGEKDGCVSVLGKDNTRYVFPKACLGFYRIVDMCYPKEKAYFSVADDKIYLHPDTYDYAYDEEHNDLQIPVFVKYPFGSYTENQLVGYVSKLHPREENGKMLVYGKDDRKQQQWLPKMALAFYDKKENAYIDLEYTNLKYGYRNYKCIYDESSNTILPEVFFMYPYESYSKDQFAGHLIRNTYHKGWILVRDEKGTLQWFPLSYLAYRRTDTHEFVKLSQ